MRLTATVVYRREKGQSSPAFFHFRAVCSGSHRIPVINYNSNIGTAGVATRRRPAFASRCRFLRCDREGGLFRQEELTMIESLSDSDVFRIPFPIWVLIDEVEKLLSGVPECITFKTFPDGATMLEVFTDRALADRYIEDAKLTNRAPLDITRSAEFCLVLLAMQMRGVQYVGFDYPADESRGEQGRYYPIQSIIDCVCKR